MANPIRFIILTATLMVVGPALHAQQITLRAGTLIRCTLYEPSFSSRTAQIGEPVICHTYPLREFGYSVFPRGSYLTGRFVDYKDPGRLVGKGWMKLEFDRLILSPTAEVPVAAKVVSVRGFRMDAEGRILGRGHPRRDTFFWTIPILWPVKLMTLPARGPFPALKGEVPITLRLLDDAEIPCVNPRPQAQLSGQLLPGDDQEEFASPLAAHRDAATNRRPRRIPILDNLEDLAWPFIGDRPARKSDAERRVEDLLRPKE